MNPHFGQSDAAMNKLFEDKDFDPVKERDAAYDQGYKDAQREHITPEPLPKGYFGHETGCDCNVCENMMMGEARRQRKEKEKEKVINLERQLSEAQAEIEKIKGNYAEIWAERNCYKALSELQQKDIADIQAKLARYEKGVEVEAYVGDLGTDYSYIYNISLPKDWHEKKVRVLVMKGE